MKVPAVTKTYDKQLRTKVFVKNKKRKKKTPQQKKIIDELRLNIYV